MGAKDLAYGQLGFRQGFGLGSAASSLAVCQAEYKALRLPKRCAAAWLMTAFFC